MKIDVSKRLFYLILLLGGMGLDLSSMLITGEFGGYFIGIAMFILFFGE